MSLSIGAAERTLANVIRAGGMWPDAAARSVPAIADWPALMQSAKAHAVTGSLYNALSHIGALAAAPPDMREALRMSTMKTLVLNTRKLAAFAEIAGDLAGRGVQVVALKGCALATTLYGDAGLRFIGDIDFLARLQDLPAVTDVVTDRGFQQQLNVFQESTRDAQLGEASYVRKDNPPTSLDVHWHIFNIPHFVRRVPVEWFWQRTTPATIQGQTVPVLNDEALLLHLCSHYILHHVAMPHLRWSCDIALLLARRRDAIDWAEVVEAARRFGLLGVLQQVLAYVTDLWDVPLAPAQQALVFGARPALRERALSRALVVKPLRPIMDGVMAGGLSRRLHYWRDVFFPNEAYMRRRYGREVGGPLLLFYLRRLRNGFRRLLGMSV